MCVVAGSPQLALDRLHENRVHVAVGAGEGAVHLHVACGAAGARAEELLLDKDCAAYCVAEAELTVAVVAGEVDVALRRDEVGPAVVAVDVGDVLVGLEPLVHLAVLRLCEALSRVGGGAILVRQVVEAKRVVGLIAGGLQSLAARQNPVLCGLEAGRGAAHVYVGHAE